MVITIWLTMLIFVLAIYFKIFFYTSNDGYLYISYTVMHMDAYKNKEQIVYTYKLFKIIKDNKEEPF